MASGNESSVPAAPPAQESPRSKMRRQINEELAAVRARKASAPGPSTFTTPIAGTVRGRDELDDSPSPPASPRLRGTTLGPSASYIVENIITQKRRRVDHAQVLREWAKRGPTEREALTHDLMLEIKFKLDATYTPEAPAVIPETIKGEIHKYVDAVICSPYITSYANINADKLLNKNVIPKQLIEAPGCEQVVTTLIKDLATDRRAAIKKAIVTASNASLCLAELVDEVCRPAKIKATGGHYARMAFLRFHFVAAPTDQKGKPFWKYIDAELAREYKDYPEPSSFQLAMNMYADTDQVSYTVKSNKHKDTVWQIAADGDLSGPQRAAQDYTALATGQGTPAEPDAEPTDA